MTSISCVKVEYEVHDGIFLFFHIQCPEDMLISTITSEQTGQIGVVHIVRKYIWSIKRVSPPVAFCVQQEKR